MQTAAMFRLKTAFSNIPLKGLFFWEGLLTLDDEEYKTIIEENFITTMRSFPSQEKDTLAYYQAILHDLQEIRKNILADPVIRNEVEHIRDALVAEAADEAVIDIVKDSLAKQGTTIV